MSQINLAKQLIVVKEPGKEPIKRYLPEINLKPMQEIVGGHIELLQIPVADDKYLDLWLNEEGKLDRLEPNLKIVIKGKIVDVIVGTIFICNGDEEGNSIGLTEEEAELATKFLNDAHCNEAERIMLARAVADMF